MESKESILKSIPVSKVVATKNLDTNKQVEVIGILQKSVEADPDIQLKKRLEALEKRRQEMIQLGRTLGIEEQKGDVTNVLETTA